MKTRVVLLMMLLMGSVTFAQDSIHVVVIGTQTWMAENLNVGTKINKTELSTNDGIVQKYCYKDLEANCDTLGALYAWAEAMAYSTVEGAQGICPTGYHVPTNNDWAILTAYLGGDQLAGRELKAAGFTYWVFPKQLAWKRYSALKIQENKDKIQGTNSTGFTAKGTGYSYAGNYVQKGTYGYAWSSTKDADGYLHGVAMNNTSFAMHNYRYYSTGYSVPRFPLRCIKN